MSIERELNVAVQVMFKHAKAVVSRNLTNAIRSGAITGIEESKIPGLEMIVNQSIDDAYKQSARQLADAVKSAQKSIAPPPVAEAGRSRK